MSALADEIDAAVRKALREELPRLLAVAVPASAPAQHLTVTEAATLARRHPDTIRRAIKAGRISAARPEGARDWLIQASEVHRWMTGEKHSAAAALDFSDEVGKAVARARGRW